MRVLHFYKTYYPDSVGGIEQVIRQMCVGTGRLGVTNEVLSLTRAKDNFDFEFEGHAVRRVPLDFEIASNAVSLAAIGRLAESTESMGLCAFARADAGRDYDLVVRAFVGAPAQFEDAASGAANATLAAWLRHNDALPGRDGRYTVSQGREVGFDARLQLRVDAQGEVWSGGHICNVVRGTIDWPA